MNKNCPVCGIATKWEKIKSQEDFEIRGEIIPVNIEISRCTECNTELENLHSEKDPYILAYEEYRRRKGLVQPEQIKKFREKYDITQKEVSNLLGMGAITLSRYENGALQDEAHDRLLKLVFEPSNLFELIQEKPLVFNEKKRKKLLTRLEKEIYSGIYTKYNSSDTPNIYSGNTLLDFPKVIQALKFFTFSQSVFKSKLLKLLFYADFKHFKDYEKSITGLQYARLPFGPVPNNYGILIGVIEKIDPTISIEQRTIGKFNGEVIVSSTPTNAEVLFDEEIKTLRKIQEYFAEFNATQIEEYSHKEKAWIETPHCELIPYHYANELSI